jgi:hypothetical protein
VVAEEGDLEQDSHPGLRATAILTLSETRRKVHPEAAGSEVDVQEEEEEELVAAAMQAIQAALCFQRRSWEPAAGRMAINSHGTAHSCPQR